MALGRPGTVAALGTAQTLAWASSYYLPAMLAAPMARDLGVSTPTAPRWLERASAPLLAAVVRRCGVSLGGRLAPRARHGDPEVIAW